MKKQTILTILFSIIVLNLLLSLIMCAIGCNINDCLNVLSITVISIIVTALVDKYYNPVEKEKDIVLKLALIKLLDNKRYFRTGLCDWVHYLYLKNIINYEEYDKIFSLMMRQGIKLNFYHWEPGRIKPRINWIKKQIKNL